MCTVITAWLNTSHTLNLCCNEQVCQGQGVKGKGAGLPGTGSEV